jgi:hypothetical protein
MIRNVSRWRFASVALLVVAALGNSALPVMAGTGQQSGPCGGTRLTGTRDGGYLLTVNWDVRAVGTPELGHVVITTDGGGADQFNGWIFGAAQNTFSGKLSTIGSNATAMKADGWAVLSLATCTFDVKAPLD